MTTRNEILHCDVGNRRVKSYVGGKTVVTWKIPSDGSHSKYNTLTSLISKQFHFLVFPQNRSSVVLPSFNMLYFGCPYEAKVSRIDTGLTDTKHWYRHTELRALIGCFMVDTAKHKVQNEVCFQLHTLREINNLNR